MRTHDTVRHSFVSSRVHACTGEVVESRFCLLIMITYNAILLISLAASSSSPQPSTFEESIRRGSDGKIIHGSDVKANPPPFFVAIMESYPIPESSDLGSYFVSGSNLFHPQFAITACHVGVVEYDEQALKRLAPGYHKYQTMNISNSYGIAGTVNIKDYEDTHQRRNVTNFYQHPDCRLWISGVVRLPNMIVWDLGVYEFKGGFAMSSRVNLIPKLDAPPYRSFYELEDSIENLTAPANCKAYGFGLTEDNHTADTMRWGEVRMVDRSHCTKDICHWLLYYDQSHMTKCLNDYNFRRTTGQRCANFTESNSTHHVNVWLGDSGGPILCTMWSGSGESTERIKSTFLHGVINSAFVPNSIPRELKDYFFYQPQSSFEPFINSFLEKHTSTGSSFLRAPPFPFIAASAFLILTFLLLNK